MRKSSSYSIPAVTLPICAALSEAILFPSDKICDTACPFSVLSATCPLSAAFVVSSGSSVPVITPLSWFSACELSTILLLPDCF